MSLKRENTHSNSNSNVASSNKAMRSALRQSHQLQQDSQQSLPIDHVVDHHNKPKLSAIIDGKLSDSYTYDLVHPHHAHQSENKNRALPIVKQSSKSDADEKWCCRLCTYQNLSVMAYCEICETPKAAKVDCETDSKKQPKEELQDGRIQPSDHDQARTSSSNRIEEIVQKIQKTEQESRRKQAMEDELVAKQLMLHEMLRRQAQEKKHVEDEQLTKALQDQLNKTQAMDKAVHEQKQKEDELLAQKLQSDFEQRQQEEQQRKKESDELMAARLQVEYDRQMLKLEKQRIESEKAALKLQAMEEVENAKYLQRQKQETEQSLKDDEEFVKKLVAEEKEQMSEQRVRDLFYRTVKKKQHKIVSVQDISQGTDKHEIYEKILNEKMNKNGQSRDQIERYLWHGTKILANLDVIIKNGFDRSYNTASAYGKGTYFARDAAYSVGGYCGQDSKGRFSILLCKVIVGEYTAGTQAVQTIPQKTDGSEYDSLVDNVADPSIFVIWRDYHALPAYLVQFK